MRLALDRLRAEKWIVLTLVHTMLPAGLAAQVRVMAVDGALGAWCALLNMLAVLFFNQTVTPRVPFLDRAAAGAALAWALLAMPGASFSAPSAQSAIAALIFLLLAAAFSAAALCAYLARRKTGQEVVLRFPLNSGRLMALQAGTLRMINAHRSSSTNPRKRGQSSAVDIVALGPAGLSALSLRPRYLEQFPIYGMPVLSPVTGVVTRLKNHIPDQAIGAIDQEHPFGNHVWLQWQTHDGPVEALLAHLRPGSILVRPGDRVRAGQQLGAVGNSGNSSEPHLHLHVQRKAPANGPLEADPVPISFEGIGLPYRNMLVDLRD